MQTDRDSKDTSVSKKKNVGKEGHAHLPNLGEEFEKLRRLRRIARPASPFQPYFLIISAMNASSPAPVLSRP